MVKNQTTKHLLVGLKTPTMEPVTCLKVMEDTNQELVALGLNSTFSNEVTSDGNNLATIEFETDHVSCMNYVNPIEL